MIRKKCILLTDKPWHDLLFDSLKKDERKEWIRVKTKDEFNFDFLLETNPDIIFIPHWSEIIPEYIYSKFECIVFHMTDLPYGRGGSPLQNLIVRKKKETKLTAIKVEKGIDTGAVYLKRSLSLEGTALEIFERSSLVIEEMIRDILGKKFALKPQEGVPEVFKRRTVADGDISNLSQITDVYDYIRMLDCPSYPPAFIEIGDLRLEFSKAKLSNSDVTSQVKITIKS